VTFLHHFFRPQGRFPHLPGPAFFYEQMDASPFPFPPAKGIADSYRNLFSFFSRRLLPNFPLQSPWTRELISLTALTNSCPAVSSDQPLSFSFPHSESLPLFSRMSCFQEKKHDSPLPLDDRRNLELSSRQVLFFLAEPDFLALTLSLFAAICCSGDLSVFSNQLPPPCRPFVKQLLLREGFYPPIHLLLFFSPRSFKYMQLPWTASFMWKTRTLFFFLPWSSA